MLTTARETGIIKSIGRLKERADNMKTINQHQYRCPVCKIKKFDRSKQFIEFIEHTNKHIILSRLALKLRGNLLDNYPKNI